MRIQIPCMLFLLFSCCFTVNSAQACTVFTSSDGRTILFAGVENEDARWMERVSCHFVPSNEKRHTYGYFYLFYNGYIAGGLNEKGLCFDIAGVPSHPADYGNLTPSNYLQSLLTRCATIEEAVGLLKKTCYVHCQASDIQRHFSTDRIQILPHPPLPQDYILLYLHATRRYKELNVHNKFL